MNFILYDSSADYTIKSLSQSLGGTPSAVCFLAKQLTQLNQKVTLVNNILKTEIIDGVEHISRNEFKSNSKPCDIFIVLNDPSDLYYQKSIQNNSNTLYALYIHNDISTFIPSMQQKFKHEHFLELVDLFIFVSGWIQNRYECKFDIPKYKSLLLKNSIGDVFECLLKTPNYEKQLNSMIYCSAPDRGLEYFLTIFPKVQEKFPQSKLTIRSGMSLYNKNNTEIPWKNEFKTIPNVDLTAPVSQYELSTLLMNHDILTYPSNTAESSCIVILQAMACGCIIVTSDLGALPETTPSYNYIVHYDKNSTEFKKNYTTTLEKVLSLSTKEKNIIRDKNRQYIIEHYMSQNNIRQFLNQVAKIFTARNQYIDSNYSVMIQQFMEYYNKEEFLNCIKTFNEQSKYFCKNQEYYTLMLNLGVSYYKLKYYDHARKYFKICLDMKDDFNINKNLAVLEIEDKNDAKSMEYMERALLHEFDLNIANLLSSKKHFNNLMEAYQLYQKILYIDPFNYVAIANIHEIDILLNLDNPEKIKQCERNMLKTLMTASTKNIRNFVNNAIVNYVITELYLENKDPLEHSTHIINLMETLFVEEPELAQITLNFNRFVFQHKLRVGYIGSDFKTHPVGFMFYNILKHHDKSKLDIYCYDLRYKKPEQDMVHQKMLNLDNSTFRYLGEESDSVILSTICKDNLDILVEMMGFTNNSKIYLLKYKPARIIVSYFAYPGTSGIPEIDYKLTDQYTTPPELQKLYVEKLWCLPNGFQTYQNNFYPVEALKRYNREDSYIIRLGYFNNPKKLSPTMIKIFSHILIMLPEAKLFFRYCLFYNCAFYRTYLKQKFIKEGVKEEQINISLCSNIAEYLDSYNDIDISLDPHPYNGGMTSHESLWMNTPFITLEGKTYHSRVGVSLLSHMNMEKYIAKNKGEYIQKTVDLGRNIEELHLLHSTIRSKMETISLGNPELFTRTLEEAYQQMKEKYI